MLLEASQALDIDLSRSWMVGDIAADSEAGKRAGCRTVLIEKPYDPVKACEITVKPDAVVTTWAAACQFILGANHRLWQAATEDNRA
jgi:phosphoglycolate phosphatase-like HAD superfamily hydrolase